MKKIIKIAIIFIVLVLMLLAGFLYALDKIKTPFKISSEEKTFIVAQGDGVFDIGPKLQKENLISHSRWFVLYVLLKGWGARLQAGQYELSASQNIPLIAAKIANGQTIKEQTDIEITIPEGFSVKQIDQRLATAGLIKPAELINFDIAKLDILGLEGYLFPDTYKFSKNTTVEQIVQKMLANFDKKLDEDLKAQITKQGRTIYDIIIMASLLEKEVRTEQERRIAAGIFWQRIKDSYPLQSCATIAYILNIDKWRYSVQDTKIKSRYNTYQNLGLPPTPICNPGLVSIKAAIYPQQTNYYFFLSKPDGQTVFSKTLDEHNQNIVKYLQ